jgi:hypothetical protein
LGIIAVLGLVLRQRIESKLNPFVRSPRSYPQCGDLLDVERWPPPQTGDASPRQT